MRVRLVRVCGFVSGGVVCSCILIFEENFPCCVSCAFKLESDDTLVIFVSHLSPNRFKDLLSAKDFHRFFSLGQFWRCAARSGEQQPPPKKQNNIWKKCFLKGLRRDELSDVSPMAHICCVWYICSSATESWQEISSLLKLRWLFIHSLNHLFTHLFIGSLLYSLKIAAWFEWRVSCLHRGNEGVSCGEIAVVWVYIWRPTEMLEFGAKMALIMHLTVCVCVCVCVITPDDYACFGRSSEGYRATSPWTWPHSLNGSVYDMMSPVWASYCLTPAHMAFSPQIHSLSVTYTLRGKDEEIGGGQAPFTLL